MHTTVTFVEREHGTLACYVHGPKPGSEPGGCACDECREACRVYERQRRRRIMPTLVDAGPAREHVNALRRAGAGPKRIAKQAGVPAATIGMLIWGDKRRNRPPTVRLRPETEQKLLSVTVTNVSKGTDRVPVGPTKRNMETLRSRGWTGREIGKRLGRAPKVGVKLGAQFVSLRTAQIIEGLLSEKPPPVWTGKRFAQPEWSFELEEKRKRDREMNRKRRGSPLASAGDGYDLPVLPDAPGAWMKRGTCRREGAPTRMFFPSSQDRKMRAAAKAMCARCPVKAECLEYALGTDAYGVWGGMSDSERQRLPSGGETKTS